MVPETPGNKERKELLLPILEKYSKLERAQVLTSLNFVPRDGGIDVEDINRQIAVWKRLGMVDAKVTPEMVLDRALLTRR
jgi:uncharacterized protein (DUF433 family)